MYRIKEDQPWKIYVLLNDKNDVIYVGATQQEDLSIRLKKGYKYIDKNSVTIHLIEETYDKTREEYWRSYYESVGCDLMNKLKGMHIIDLKEWKRNRSNNWYYENPDKVKEWKEKNPNYLREWLSDPDNKERVKEAQKRWKEKNKEKLREYYRNYYNKNKQNQKEA